ncbi:MAG: hypothetical protein Q4G66_11850 [bacterium]|nr:hypothetical protein [bacterium]
MGTSRGFKNRERWGQPYPYHYHVEGYAASKGRKDPDFARRRLSDFRTFFRANANAFVMESKPGNNRKQMMSGSSSGCT